VRTNKNLFTIDAALLTFSAGNAIMFAAVFVWAHTLGIAGLVALGGQAQQFWTAESAIRRDRFHLVFSTVVGATLIIYSIRIYDV
jgi:hypothetical protein